MAENSPAGPERAPPDPPLAPANVPPGGDPQRDATAATPAACPADVPLPTEGPPTETARLTHEGSMESLSSAGTPKSKSKPPGM